MHKMSAATEKFFVWEATSKHLSAERGGNIGGTGPDLSIVQPNGTSAFFKAPGPTNGTAGV
jgi:hypothetical protein